MIPCDSLRKPEARKYTTIKTLKMYKNKNKNFHTYLIEVYFEQLRIARLHHLPDKTENK
jgi:hypothetical protein